MAVLENDRFYEEKEFSKSGYGSNDMNSCEFVIWSFMSPGPVRTVYLSAD